MKKIITTFLCALFLAVMAIPAYAQDAPKSYAQHIEYQEDSGYFVIEMIQASAKNRSNTTSGTKRATYYDTSNTPVFTVEVTGIFTYNSATADSASVAVYIHDGRASYKNKGVYTSNASAIGYANIELDSHPIYKSVTLTCNKDGRLS